MQSADIRDVIRMPIGRHRGCVAAICADDLAAMRIVALMTRNVQPDLRFHLSSPTHAREICGLRHVRRSQPGHHHDFGARLAVTRL